MNSQKIALLVDSGIDIPKHIREQYNMYSIPLKIIYKEREYSDGVDITAEEIYSKLSEEIPKTSLPSTGEILEKLAEIKEDGYEKVLIVTLSSGLSGTFKLKNILLYRYIRISSKRWTYWPCCFYTWNCSKFKTHYFM